MLVGVYGSTSGTTKTNPVLFLQNDNCRNENVVLLQKMEHWTRNAVLFLQKMSVCFSGNGDADGHGRTRNRPCLTASLTLYAKIHANDTICGAFPSPLAMI